MKERRGAAIAVRSGQRGGSFKYHVVEDSEDQPEHNFSQGEHPSSRTLEHHLRKFRNPSRNRLVLIVVGVIAVVLVLFWAVA